MSFYLPRYISTSLLLCPNINITLTIFHDSEKLIIDLDANLISSLLAVIFWKDLRQAGILSQL